MLSALEHRISAERLRVAWAQAFSANADVLALIEKRGEPAALLTNNGPVLDACLDHELASISRLFDHRLLSYRFGHAKPDQRVFRAVTELLEVAPGDLLLIDDDSANTAAALDSGWHAITFTNVAALREALPPPWCP